MLILSFEVLEAVSEHLHPRVESIDARNNETKKNIPRISYKLRSCEHSSKAEQLQRCPNTECFIRKASKSFVCFVCQTSSEKSCEVQKVQSDSNFLTVPSMIFLTMH